MGLIHNNSRYEVTRVDPESATHKPKDESSGASPENKEKVPTSSELLLELMVRIAAHPDQWDKVHKLLQTINDDLNTSRDIIRRLETATDTLIAVNKKMHGEENYTVPKTFWNYKTGEEKDTSRNVARSAKNSTKGEEEKKWPVFESSSVSSVQFVNSSGNVSERNQQTEGKTAKATYQKNFAYHRVTGTPMSLDKPPKAYIAVSVVDPPQPASPSSEDVILENELHRLKPVSETTSWRIRKERQNRDRRVV